MLRLQLTYNCLVKCPGARQVLSVQPIFRSDAQHTSALLLEIILLLWLLSLLIIC